MTINNNGSVETDREMLIELLELHGRALRRMPWVQGVLVIGVGLFVFPFVSLTALLAWGILTVSVEIWRARYAAGVPLRDEIVNPTRIHHRFVALAAVSGLAIAVGAIMFLPRLPVWQQAFFGVVLIAIPSTGVAVSQSSRNILAAYAISIMVPAGITWCLLHPNLAVGGALLVALMLTVLILVASDGEKLLRRSVVIRHDRDRLVRDLELRNADVHSAMAQAEQSAQARARVLAAASHDLRQPLHALSVYSAVLAANPAPATLGEVSQNIDQIVRSLGNLLNGLLDLSRLSTGYYVPENKIISVDKIASDICAEYQNAARQKKIALRQQLVPIQMLGDSLAIGRIIRNLLDNAIKYTDSGEVGVSIQLDSSKKTPRVILKISDTGKGIPASEQTRIFEEFYQLDNAGRDRSKGVGLGLAIVQRLCELIHGEITVASEVGQGTCFTVSVPAILAETTPDGVREQPVSVALQGRRIYVLDDEFDILKSMRALLGTWGANVLTASSVGEAEGHFQQLGAPDLLIVDLRLSAEEHGAQVADRMQQRYGRFPVLIITGETSSDSLRQANGSGYLILQKPITAEILRRAIASTMTEAVGALQSAH